jgi:hypothetical protein
MRSTTLTFGYAILLGAAVGCAETPPPATVATPEAKPAPPAVAVTPSDLTPVAEPADIFFSARWKNPNATLSGLSACAGVPETMVEGDARSLVDKALANAFRGGADGRRIAELVAFDAPVDMVVALDPVKRLPPQALYAFSIGLTSLERAKQEASAAGGLTEVAPGLWRLGVKDAGDLTCVVGAAAGKAPARLICGQRDKDVATLGPYLARNMPVAELPKEDVHAELRFVPVDARYGNDIRRGLGILPNYARTQTIGDPRYDQALEDAATALADEGAALVADLDRVTLDLGVDPTSCLTAKTAIQLRGKTSWLAGTIADGGTKSGPPPAIFWRAPADADSASYGHATDVTRYGGIFRTLRNLIEGKLAREQIGTEADRKALAALVNLPLGKDTNVVVASGHTHGNTKQIPAGAKLTEQQIADEMLNSYLGWYLLGFDEGPEALTKLLKDVVSVYGRKGLTDPLRRELGRDADMLPVAKFVAPPRELGKGGLDLEIKFEVKAKGGDKKPVNIVLHALLMGEGKNTWIAIGPNRDDLLKHLAAVKSGAPDSGTLASRAGLEPLKSGKAVSSGFLTLAMFTRGLSSVLGNPAFTSQLKPSASGPLEEVARALNNLPNRGATPIFVVTEAQPGTGPRSEFSLQVQKGSFEDLGMLLMVGQRLANKSGMIPSRP